jgi:cell division protein FtsA
MSVPPIVVLEVGTSKVRAVVGEAREDGNITISGVGECSSRGIRKGEIIDFDNALACVRKALSLAEENSPVIINEVHLVVSGGHIRSMVNRGSVPISEEGGEITAENVEHVMETARAVSLPQDQEVLHTICQHFYVDDQDGVINPEGMEGSKLAVDVLILHGTRSRLRNVIRVVRSAKVDVFDVAFSGLCAALGVLTPEEKESGVVVIDLGGGTTDYVVYARSMIAGAGAFGVGGDHVTNDIARGLHLKTTEAEQLKEEFGSAVVDLSARTQRISIPAEPGTAERVVKLSDLDTIIHVRMEETLSLVKTQLAHDDLLSSLGAGVVLVGGGAKMKQVDRLAERVFGLPCRIGTPVNISGLATVTGSPEFAALVGMVRYGVKTAPKESAVASIGAIIRKFFTRSGR